MRKIVYRDRLIVFVGEINRAKALQVAQTVTTLLDADIDNPALISNEFHFAYVTNAPVKILFDGKVLEDGKHVLSFGEYDDLEITLPINRECFDALPVSLTADWIKAAEAENEWLSDHFLSIMKLTVPMLFEPASDNMPS